jgi:hypothetical protein
MKNTGIVLIVLGGISAFGSLMANVQGHAVPFPGLVLVVIGAFLISRANKKKDEEDKRKAWESGNSQQES